MLKSYKAAPEYERSRVVIDEDGIERKLGDLQPVVLVQKRDPSVWRKDPRVKKIKKETSSSNITLADYLRNYDLIIPNKINSNLSITIKNHVADRVFREKLL